MSINKIMKEGNQCSKNFKFKKRVNTITELMEILETQPSIYWNHRPYPCAVVMQQKLVVLMNAINYGRMWEITKIQGGNNEQKVISETASTNTAQGYWLKDLKIQGGNNEQQ